MLTLLNKTSLFDSKIFIAMDPIWLAIVSKAVSTVTLLREQVETHESAEGFCLQKTSFYRLHSSVTTSTVLLVGICVQKDFFLERINLGQIFLLENAIFHNWFWKGQNQCSYNTNGFCPIPKFLEMPFFKKIFEIVEVQTYNSLTQSVHPF